MPLTLGLSIAISGAFGTVQTAPPPPPVAHHIVHQIPVHTTLSAKANFASAVMASPADPTVQAAVKDYFSDIPIMISIAGCESKFHQYDLSGGILTSVTDDLGVMQINVDTHAGEALNMGFDLTDIQDNMAFARYLYNQNGTAPWSSSSKCWKGASASASVAAPTPLAVRTK